MSTAAMLKNTPTKTPNIQYVRASGTSPRQSCFTSSIFCSLRHNDALEPRGQRHYRKRRAVSPRRLKGLVMANWVGGTLFVAGTQRRSIEVPQDLETLA